MPLHPIKYAEMLGKKILEQNVNVWLINTGWSGVNMEQEKTDFTQNTRAMITAILNDDLENINIQLIKCLD